MDSEVERDRDRLISQLSKSERWTEELEREFRRAWETLDRLRSVFREEFERDLPLDEMIFDRWDRAASLGFGA